MCGRTPFSRPYQAKQNSHLLGNSTIFILNLLTPVDYEAVLIDYLSIYHGPEHKGFEV